MTNEQFHHIILQLKEINFSGRLSFDFYNEPTMHPKLKDFIKFAHETLPQINTLLYSNGTLLSSDKIDQLFLAGLTKLVVTQHEESSGRDFSYLKNVTWKDQLVLQSHHVLKKTNRSGSVAKLNRGQQIGAPCFIPSKILSISLKGNITSCFEDFHQEITFGNVFEKSIKEIWSSDNFIEFRKSLSLGFRAKYPTCSRCSRIETLNIH